MPDDPGDPQHFVFLVMGVLPFQGRTIAAPGGQSQRGLERFIAIAGPVAGGTRKKKLRPSPGQRIRAAEYKYLTRERKMYMVFQSIIGLHDFCSCASRRAVDELPLQKSRLDAALHSQGSAIICQ
jgi:hypothetical protein